jgi:hypothetical protein
LKNSLRAAHGCAAIFQARFMCLKNEAKQKTLFLLCVLKKAMEGLFQQPASGLFLLPWPTRFARHPPLPSGKSHDQQ